MSRFELFQTPLAGLITVQRKVLEDHRGFLSRLYCADDLGEAGMHKPIAQINHTLTRRKGSVRGMHFQHPPFAEIKFVSCLKGEVLDVAIDLRRNSPTFLHWHGELLSAVNRRSMLIPEGFAHGFQTLTEDCELLYLHTAAYQPGSEGTINATDPRLDIDWPLPIADLSERDCGHPYLKPDFPGIAL